MCGAGNKPENCRISAAEYSGVGLTPPLSLTPSVSLSDDQNDNFIGLSRTIEECKTGM